MRYLPTLVLVAVALAGATPGGAAPRGGALPRALALQPPSAAPAAPAVPDGFEPVANERPTEQLPAAPFVMAAYAFVWIALLAYLWSIWRRLAAVERDLADLTRRIADAGRRQ
jgi:CcmD family protein